LDLRDFGLIGSAVVVFCASGVTDMATVI
jgi:hypothetical protein